MKQKHGEVYPNMSPRGVQNDSAIRELEGVMSRLAAEQGAIRLMGRVQYHGAEERAGPVLQGPAMG